MVQRPHLILAGKSFSFPINVAVPLITAIIALVQL